MDDLMSFILSHHLAEDSALPNVLTAEVFYAFIEQNLPEALPGNLLQATNDWETMPQLIELTRSGIVFLNNDLIVEALDNAIGQNLVSLQVKMDKDVIKTAFSSLRQAYALDKPILIGNANLKTLLDESSIADGNYGMVADLLVSNNGINNNFWDAIKADGAITEKDIEDFEAVVTLGSITKNHLPTMKFLKKDIGSSPNKKFKKPSDVAKLSDDEFKLLIEANGNSVPENIPGSTMDEKVTTYAKVLQSRAEFTFPMVAMVAAVKKGDDHTLTKIDDVEKFIDEHTGMDFKTENLDKYLKENGIQVDKAVREEVKVFQRIHKLTPKAAAGKVLIEEGLHGSAKIYALSKSRLTNLFEARGVEAKYAVKLHEQAKSQYAQILAKLMEYAPQIHWGNPRAIIKQTYSKKELKDALGDIPNLETLFGSLDFCECEHCKSLYGPAAYFTDLIRFLKEHNSLIV